MIGALLLGLCLAVAGEPVDGEPTAGETIDGLFEELGEPAEGEPAHEIWVFGELMVDRARVELIADLQAEGYTDVVDKGDYIRVRHPQPYKGELHIYDDGWVRMKRQPVRLEAPEMPWAKKNSAGAWASCILFLPGCIKTGGQLVSRRRWLGVQGRTISSSEETIERYADRVADYRTEETINDLPERLELLWVEGVPLSVGATLQTREERRAALLDYWDTRTDTVWGDRVRLAVEAFFRAEVQSSEWPLTDAEIEAANDRRTCTRVLDLRRPWDEVMAEVDTPY